MEEEVQLEADQERSEAALASIAGYLVDLAGRIEQADPEERAQVMGDFAAYLLDASTVVVECGGEDWDEFCEGGEQDVACRLADMAEKLVEVGNVD